MTLYVLLALALPLYVAATIWHRRGGGAAGEVARARAAAGTGVLLHAVALVVGAVVADHVPGFAESLSAVSLGVMVAYLLGARGRLEELGRFLLPVGVVLLSLSLVVPSPRVTALATTSTSWWLPVHLALVVAGTVGFLVELMVGGAGWMVRRRLKAKRFVGLERLPPLEVLDRVQLRALVFGLVCMGAGIAAGGLWAATTMHHARWAGDPKVWTSVGIWAWYAASLAVRQVRGFPGQATLALSGIGFLALVFSVVGLDFVTAGFHAYGP